MLLDLRLPGKSGYDVLRWIRSQEDLRLLRVVVLTSSDDIKDINNVYAAGANSFLVKPFDFQNAVEMAKLLTRYWLKADRAPKIEPQK